MQKVSEGDTGDISNMSIYAHYHKLPNKSESNRKKSMKPNIFHVVLDLIEFSRGISKVSTIVRDMNQKSRILTQDQVSPGRLFICKG